MSQGLPHEEDLFLARCTLLTATAGPSSAAAAQLDAAGRLLEAYEGVTGRGLPDTPLAHFVRLYLEVRPGLFLAKGDGAGGGNSLYVCIGAPAAAHLSFGA